LCEKEGRKKKFKKVTKSDFFSGLFLNSSIFKGKVTSIFMNCNVVSMDLQACFAVLQFFWPLFY